MAIPFEEGVQLQPPSRCNAIVHGDDLIELEQDGLGGSVLQFATVAQAVELAGLLLSAVQAALAPGELE